MLLGQKLSFWGAVAVVSLLAQFGLEAVTHKAGSPGLAKFTAYAHKGTG